MSRWQKIASQNDIDELLSFYVGFHDSCIVSANYQSGAFVDEKGAMGNGDADQHELLVVFHSQWKPQIELCFTGLRQLHLAGWQENYFCDIFGAHLSFYDSLLPGTPSRVIVWSDNESFDVQNLAFAIREPSDTYIVANALKWRVIDRQ